MNTILSPVEQLFCSNKENKLSTNIPYITVENFPQLGLLTALRFIEWVSKNPEGVISLPTGKTPEYFIVWVKKILSEWNTPNGEKFRKENNLIIERKPNLSNLRFVQIDEFYPISSNQHNSFCNYVKKYYIKGFGLDENKALFIDCEKIPLAEGKHFSEIFDTNIVDLSLRCRSPKSIKEKLQQESIFLIDDWCSEYEQKIMNMGGIGFFLGGIGPDGHIAFNTRGSDPHSTTRLTSTNFETQAAAAGDLGGIEISSKKPVITIGLQTITRNKHAVAIIFAAGEAKAQVVANALEKTPCNMYPASSLSKLPNARFYITLGAASLLKDSVLQYFNNGAWNQEKTNRAVIDLCKKLNKFGKNITIDDLENDEFCKLIPNINENTVNSVIKSIENKIEKGTDSIGNQTFLHTGPHHDDIMLGMLPHIHRLSRNETNKSHFTIMTSGFNAVTNNFLTKAIEDTLIFLNKNRIQMVNYPNFFEDGYKKKRDKDVYHYLIKIASGQPEERRRGFAHRLVRNTIEIWNVKNETELREQLTKILEITKNSYDGEKLPADIQKFKGMIREFEEELVWAYFGMTGNDVTHLRLGFYTGDIFTEKPNRERDVEPILQQLKQIKPSIISLAFDPEGSGPDTHYKVLQASADAIREWRKEENIENLKIWGYRNVWFQFHPSEATHIVPVSLNAMGVLDNAFENCYLSQVDASFPSYKLNGKFSELAIQTWVEQLKDIQLLLGKDFFYQNESPRLRTTHGLLYFKEMNIDEFLSNARELEKSIGGK